MINNNSLSKKLLLINNQEQITNSIIQCINNEYSYIEFNLDENEKIIQAIKDSNFFTIFINLNDPRYNILNLISSINDIKEIPIVVIIDKNTINSINSLLKSLNKEIYLFIEKPLNLTFLSMVIRNIYEFYRLKEEANILFQNLIESNKKIEEGNKHLKEIEDKIEQLLSLRYA